MFLVRLLRSLQPGQGQGWSWSRSMGLGGGSSKSWQGRLDKGGTEPPCIITTHQAHPHRRRMLAPDGLLSV